MRLKTCIEMTIAPSKKNPVLYICGRITAEKGESFVTHIKQIASDCDQLDLVMNSEGGSVAVALEIARFMLSIDLPIRTVNIGCVDSAAIIIYVAASKRICDSGATFLFHRARQECHGCLNADEFRKMFLELINDERRIIKHISDQTSLKEHKIENLML